MDERPPDEPSEESLKRLLESWTVGSPSEALEARLRQTFEAETRQKRGRWRRWFGATVQVPVPILVGLVVACLVSAAFAVAGRAPFPTAVTQQPSPPPPTARGPVDRNASLVGFEPVPEPRVTVFRPGERP